MSYEPHQETPLARKGYLDDTTEASRHRLCCCHVRTWALVIAALEIVAAVLNLISGIVEATAGTNTKASPRGMLAWGVIQFIIWIIIAVLLIYGVRKEKPWYLIPNMVWQVRTQSFF